MALKRTKLKARSTKQADVAQQLHAVYAQIARERPQVCAGCGGQAGGPIKLSHSHLVPRSYNAALITDPANIAYHCVNWLGHTGCHTLWESNAMRHTLIDFDRNMAYIEQADPAYFRLLQLKTILPSAV